jgi:hypothetical protein
VPLHHTLPVAAHLHLKIRRDDYNLRYLDCKIAPHRIHHAIAYRGMMMHHMSPCAFVSGNSIVTASPLRVIALLRSLIGREGLIGHSNAPWDLVLVCSLFQYLRYLLLGLDRSDIGVPNRIRSAAQIIRVRRLAFSFHSFQLRYMQACLVGMGAILGYSPR